MSHSAGSGSTLWPKVWNQPQICHKLYLMTTDRQALARYLHAHDCVSKGLCIHEHVAIYPHGHVSKCMWPWMHMENLFFLRRALPISGV
jgi:hypothetical protein